MANPQFMPPPPAPQPPNAGPQGLFPPPQNQQFQNQNSNGPQNFGGPPVIRVFPAPNDDHNVQRGRAANMSAPLSQDEKNPKYEGVTLRKDPNPPYGAEPSWARVHETPSTSSHDELVKMVKKRGKDNIQKELQKLKSDNQRYQIEQVLAARKQAEWNQDVEWSLAVIDEERGQGKRVSETETKAIHLILKRQLKSKTKPANNRRTSDKVAVPPGIVRDLNDPMTLQNGRTPFPKGPPHGPPHGSQQHGPPHGPQQHGPHQGPQQGPISGSMPGQGRPFPNQPGPPNFQNPQMGGPPIQNHPQGPPQFQPNQNGFRPQNMPPPPPQQHFPQPRPPPPQVPAPPPPPPPPPASFPVKGKQAQGGKRAPSPSEDYFLDDDDDDDSIVIVESNSRSRRTEKGSKHANRSRSRRRMSHSSGKGGNHRHSNSSDSENSSYLSKGSSRFTNITSPTSGGSARSMELKRSKSGRERRYSEMDDRAEPRGRDRRGSNTYSDDMLDDFLYARARRNSSLGRDGRPRDRSRSPSYKEVAIYEPRRAPTTTELLQEKALLRLERLALEEEDRLSQSIRDREFYERERSRRSYDNRSLYSLPYDRSPSGYGYGRRF